MCPKNPEIPTLAGELFFHNVDPEDENNCGVTRNVRNGQPLFGLRGRAVVERGTPFTPGSQLVFRIPQDRQPQLLASPGNTKYEDWMWGSKQSLALGSPVPDVHRNAAKSWLRRLTEVLSNGPISGDIFRSNPPEIKEVRCLPAEYLIAEVEAKGEEQEHIRLCVPKKVLSRKGAPPPRGDITTRDILEAIRYYANSIGHADYRDE